MINKSIFWIVCFLILFSFEGWAQNDRQKQLEAQRIQLRNEIKQINNLLSTSRQQKSATLEELEEVNLRIDRITQLVKITNQQINLLTQRIRVNEREIGELRKELKQLKADYAQMIRASYDSKSHQNRLMFLLSSESFLQGYKRVQYLKQYASFRKKQGVAIAEKTVTLQDLNTDLLVQKSEKEALVSENREIQSNLLSQKKRQNELLNGLKKKEQSFAAQIKEKQRKTVAIDREIDRLIREAIAASNKKAGTKSATFALTPEAKLLASNFAANRGKLPWPVTEGVVTQGFGTQPHPVVRTAKIKSNGVVIATPKNAKVRTVFDGQVLSIIQFKGSNPIVLVQHGNYVTAYKNLSKIFVKKGDKLVAKQEIGEVFASANDNKSSLQFSIFKDNTPQNPSGWIYKM